MTEAFGITGADAWRRHANPWAWGLIVLDPWITAFGVAVQMLGKLWFLNRMALLYDEVVTS